MSGELLCILRAPATTTEKEKEQITKLDKYQKKYLSRLCCGLCDHTLDKIGCGAVYAPACEETVRIERRERALKQYKPRLNRRKQ